MRSRSFLFGLVGLISAVSAAPQVPPPPQARPHHPPPPPPPPHHSVKPWSTFDENVIYQPDDKHSVLYPRQVELSDGSLLATASYSGDQPPYFPIFRSADGGATWSWFSNLTDQVNGLGMSAQPALAELPFAVGEYPAGTVLASGNSWGSDSTNIDLYASKDKGRTWKFVSNVARGSGPNTTNGNPCIWEPFFNNTIGVFYSDQRDPLHGQKLAHQESTDLKSWGAVINDVAYLNYTARPGMTTIAYMPPIQRWILTIADSPFDFRFAYGVPIMVNGVQPSSSPYVVWSSVGGPNGTIIVSDADNSGVFTNRASGQPDQWELHETPQPPAYSRSLHIFSKNPDHLMLLGAGVFGGTTNLPLYLSVVSVSDTLRKPSGK
ncbi:hypothetical protein N7539_006540 [Penicillium diatomitis]|uniref:Glycoside hydrolase family 93 protein n=1 Tax=Penicillium diatomitis TaxID=2819901 RepID=A0A9W9X4J9_9EURO|nr:uncharacterized protein N7539_006540 [Penicillium diatomitis]KAJ5483094.1 hypothetical protein N7539_006540 [Penicillium diatomitis]